MVLSAPQGTGSADTMAMPSARNWAMMPCRCDSSSTSPSMTVCGGDSVMRMSTNAVPASSDNLPSTRNSYRLDAIRPLLVSTGLGAPAPRHLHGSLLDRCRNRPSWVSPASAGGRRRARAGEDLDRGQHDEQDDRDDQDRDPGRLREEHEHHRGARCHRARGSPRLSSSSGDDATGAADRQWDVIGGP